MWNIPFFLIDIDECANDDFTCDEKEYCSNTIGSYTCKCDSGTRRNPTSGECENIDECEEELDDCDPVLEICRDTEQSYTCDCMNGFERTSEDEACEGSITVLRWTSSGFVPTSFK